MSERNTRPTSQSRRDFLRSFLCIESNPYLREAERGPVSQGSPKEEEGPNYPLLCGIQIVGLITLALIYKRLSELSVEAKLKEIKDERTVSEAVTATREAIIDVKTIVESHNANLFKEEITGWPSFDPRFWNELTGTHPEDLDFDE